MLGMGGGGTGFALVGGRGGPPPGAASFLVFGGSTASFDDQVGSLNFTNTGSQMTLNSSTHGGPPGFSDSGLIAGGTGNNTGNVRTADDVIPDLSGDFTIDCCGYNTQVPASNSSMLWSVGNYGQPSDFHIYNASGTSRFDTSVPTWSGRLGEGGGSTNYTQNKWCVSRLRRSGNTTYASWYEENASGTGWDLKSGSYSGTTTGTGPNIGNSTGGRMILNGWATQSGGTGVYQVNSSQLSIAWIVVYTSSFTGTPYVG